MAKDVKYIYWVKRCQNIFYWVKKDLFGCFTIEEIRDKNNATGLKEGGGIEMSTTVLPLQILTVFLSRPNTIYLIFE